MELQDALMKCCVAVGVQGNADKVTKQLEAQLAELNAKLEQSAREIVELNSVKARSQAESAEHSRQIEEAESQINQLTKFKQNLSKQLEEAKASLEEETRLRAKFQSEARNFQVKRRHICLNSFFPNFSMVTLKPFGIIRAHRVTSYLCRR